MPSAALLLKSEALQKNLVLFRLEPNLIPGDLYLVISRRRVDACRKWKLQVSRCNIELQCLMRGQSQLVIFVSSQGVRRAASFAPPRRAPIQRRVVARRPQRSTRAPSSPSTENSGYFIPNLKWPVGTRTLSIIPGTESACSVVISLIGASSEWRREWTTSRAGQVYNGPNCIKWVIGVRHWIMDSAHICLLYFISHNRRGSLVDFALDSRLFVWCRSI